MIFPTVPQTTEAVAAHYDELDAFYREVWGEHVHHGYWASGRETPEAAADLPRGPDAEPGRSAPAACWASSRRNRDTSGFCWIGQPRTEYSPQHCCG